LLSTTAAPQTIIDLLPDFESIKRELNFSRKDKLKRRKVPMVKHIPIGLRLTDPEGWINALMQFILFVPGFTDMFFFAPRSFQPFKEFIDQYHFDQEENRPLSFANGAALRRFLSVKLPNLGILGVFEFLIRSLHREWKLQKKLEGVFGKDIFLT
jgi:hypothetical protein